MVILETERTILRHPVIEDVDDYHAFYRDPEIRRYIPDAPRNWTEAREEVEYFLDGHPKNSQLGLWATIHKDTGRFIGRCGLLPWTIEGRQEVEVAYAISRDFQGIGLGTEAARAVLDYALGRLHLPRLVSLIYPQNIASRRVAEKIGMTLETEIGGWEGDGIPFLVYAISDSAPKKAPDFTHS